MRLVQTTNPADMPVTLQEAREQCAVYDDTTHDSMLVRLIQAATREAEHFLNGPLVSRSMRLDLDGFPRGTDIVLPTYPVQSITSVVYDDIDDNEQAFTAYHTALDGMRPTIRVLDGWENTYANKLSSVRITFVAGYSDVQLIPQDIKNAILIRVYELWRERGENLIGIGVTSIKLNSMESLLSASRKYCV